MTEPPEKGKPISLLLVEDNPGDVRLIREFLSEAKVDKAVLITAGTLSRGMELLDCSAIDAVLLDLGLPDSQGLDTFTTLNTAFKHLPIVVLSSLNDESIALAAVQKGAQDYLVKGQVDGHVLSHSIRYAIERKQAEELLIASEEKYRALVENINDVLYTLDTHGNITYISPAVERFTGYKVSDLMGRPFTPLVHTDDLPGLLDSFNRLASGQLEPWEFRVVDKDGESIFVRSSSRPIYKDGQIVGFTALLTNITERKLFEEKLVKSYESVKKTLNDAINTMVKIVELRDPYTAGHQQKVAALATAIAGEMNLGDARIDQLRIAAVIHDIGKIYIPSDILSKPGKLSAIEFSLIKTHAQSGYDIVKSMDFPGIVAQAVLQHHERLDGSGYPSGLKSDDTILEAKILAVADVIEAMASHRPYRSALGIDKALEEISKNKGKLYDPDAVDICYRLFSEKSFSFEQQTA
jgi:PAS domain S-box-containing protein/putative nucleotidyltransferase with HDIG domain